MAVQMQRQSSVHPYSGGVPRVGIVSGAAAALERARGRQESKSRSKRQVQHIIIYGQTLSVDIFHF